MKLEREGPRTLDLCFGSIGPGPPLCAVNSCPAWGGYRVSSKTTTGICRSVLAWYSAYGGHASTASAHQRVLVVTRIRLKSGESASCLVARTRSAVGLRSPRIVSAAPLYGFTLTSPTFGGLRLHRGYGAEKDVNLIEEVKISFELAAGRRVGCYRI